MKNSIYSAKIELNESIWDSKVFGLKCGFFDVSSQATLGMILDFLAEAKKNGFRFLTTRVLGEDLLLANHCLQANGMLVDTEITLYKKKEEKRFVKLVTSDRFSFVRKKTYWNDDLFPLAKTLHHSRFFRDPQIDESIAVKLWKKSIYNNCKGRGEYSVICFDKKRPIGLANIFEKDETSDIYLIAFLPEYQKLGLGKAMIAFYENHLETDIKTQIVATQACNYPAQKLYTSAGYTTASVKHIIHFWL